jgi:hypothetical protein
MNQPLAITDFDFATELADADRLVEVWLPEIERVLTTFERDDRFIAFLTAALRIGARSKNLKHLKHLNLMDVVEKAGYSRSTFFRLFEGYTGFLFKGYQLSCLLTTKVYAQHLVDQQCQGGLVFGPSAVHIGR